MIYNREDRMLKIIGDISNFLTKLNLPINIWSE